MLKMLLVLVLSLTVSTSVWADANLYALERFHLNDFVLKNIKPIGNEKVATIQNKNNYDLYTVIVGDRMGINFGMIKKIENDKLYICEVVQDEENDWIEKCHWIHKCAEYECLMR